MKEYYTNFKGQKRRLKIYHGDIVICERQDKNQEANAYKVIHEHSGSEYPDKWSLYYLSCGRMVTSGWDKEELKQHLLGHFQVRQVIAKHELIDIVQEHVPMKLIKD